MSNRAIIEKELTQGVVPIGTPKAYQYDQALVESAVATVMQGLVKLDDYTEEKKSEYLNYATTILQAIQNQYGYPFVANTVAAMTDVAKIYVYTGNETGYTAGNWYYNNGAAWVSGGVFNSTEANVRAEMSLFGIDDLLWDNTNTSASSVSNGITYTLDKINKTVTVSGTSTNYSAKVFYTGAIPAWLAPGKTYYANMDTQQNVFLQVRQTVNGTDTLIADVQHGSQGFVIDSTATVVTIRLYVKTAGVVLSGIVRPFVSATPLGITEEDVLRKCNDVAVAVSTETLNALNKVDSWELNAYINENSGNVEYLGNVTNSVSNLISVPKGTEIHIHGAYRIGLYNDDGSTKSVILSPGIDYIVSSNDASYVRISRESVDPSVLAFYVAYYFKATDDAQSIDSRIDTGCTGVQYNGRPTTDIVGNPVVLRDCGDREFQMLTISGATSGEKLTICNKNIFAIRHTNGTFTRNNVHFAFNTVLNTIRIYSNGATAITTSGFSEFGDDYKYINGNVFYHNFKVKFPVDTRIYLTDNADGEVTFDFGVQMRVYDGSVPYSVGTGGTSILCEANKEYGLYFLVREGWSGDITYSPQVELNDHATSYELFNGIHTVIPSTGNENIFECGGTAPGRYTTGGGKIVTLFDSATNEIYINANNDTNSNVIIYDTSKDGLVNGEDFYYIYKFSTTADMPVYIKMFDKKYAQKIYAQVSDGTTSQYDFTGRGIYIFAEANKEYAVRIFIIQNEQVNCILKPVIATGIYAIKEYGTHGDTTIYTDGSAVITAKRWYPSTQEKSERAYSIADDIITLTGGHISTPFGKLFKRGAMVSFIDDDTTSATYVQRYHDIFTAKGQLGGYAVETKNLNEHEGLPELLLDYETEGFACLYHCYYQAGDETRYWIKGHPDYNQTLINENFMRGLREIRQYGFSNYKYWVTPYGVNDKYIVDLAKNHGMECLLNCPGGYNQEGFVSPYGNISRWNIPRLIFGNYENNDDLIHHVIQGAKATSGWVVIVSHVNSWGSNVDAMTTRLSNLIQYCIDEGVEIVPFPVGYEEYRSAFLLNELL